MAIRVHRPIKIALIACLIALFIAGCGQKGDLYLPDGRAPTYVSS